MNPKNDYLGPIDIEITRLDLKPSRMVRASRDAEVIERYAETIDKLPAIDVCADEKDKHWVEDGYYRVQAYLKAGRKTIPAMVRRGSFDDAFIAACHANTTHGVPRTNADKKHAVLEALKMYPDAAEKTQQQLADMCGVSQMMVSLHDKRVFKTVLNPVNQDSTDKHLSNGKAATQTKTNRPKGGRPRQTAEEKERNKRKRQQRMAEEKRRAAMLEASQQPTTVDPKKLEEVRAATAMAGKEWMEPKRKRVDADAEVARILAGLQEQYKASSSNVQKKLVIAVRRWVEQKERRREVGSLGLKTRKAKSGG